MYTLAGLANPNTGWGIRDESWNVMAMLSRYEAPTWFRLGDRDLATHLLRSQWLRQGFPLSWVTRELCKLLGVRHPLLPMSDAPVRTVVVTERGELLFQEYFVRYGWQPVVEAIRFDGVETAQPTQEVVAALRAADLIVFCPSNPFVSLDPILALPAVRRIVVASRAPKVAVSPIVGGQAIKGPAAKLMRELGMQSSAFDVAAYYRDLLTGFVLDQQDAGLQDALRSQLALRALVTNTIMRTDVERVELARQTLEFGVQL
jgi:LPPG:FO 2-phospho-L-lactate transferase